MTGDIITFARMNQKTLIVQAAEPAILYPGMIWADTDDNVLYQRNAANAAWNEILKDGISSVTGMSGLLADDQHVLDAEVLAVAAALVHAARHKDGGADELDVSELAGGIGAAGEIPETDGAAVTWVEPDGRYDPKAHVLATTGPHTNALPLIDLEVGVQGEVIHRGGADWEALAVGVDGQVLMSGGAAADIAWEDHDKALHDALGINADTVDGVHEADFLLVAGTRNRLIPDPSGDHSARGDTISATAGENVAIGDLCYFKNDGKFWLADADAEATAKGWLVLATAAITAEATGVFLTYGKYRDDTWGWTVAQELYIHTTGGNPTGTRPVGANDIVRIIGHASDTNILFFNPDQTYLELV